MRYAHTVAQVRDAEAPLLAGLPPGALMQRAVAGLVAHAARRLDRVYGARVVVLAGGGANGGDALWAGARLATRGARVDALAPGRTHPEGTAALLAAGGRLHRFTGEGAGEDDRGDGGRRSSDHNAGRGAGTGVAVGGGGNLGNVGKAEAARIVDAADLVLDGLLGIGGRGGLRGAYAQLAAMAAPERTVAVDVPSGVDPDTGAVPGPAIRASSTVTFGTLKRGLLLPPGAYHAGRVELVDIGLTLPLPDLTALDDTDVAALLPRAVPESSKYTRGVLGLVAGSDPYPGAAVLATGGALRSAAGYLRVVTTAEAARAVRAAHPEAVVTTVEPGDAGAVLGAGRVQAWAVGSGLPPGPPTVAVVRAVLGAGVPVLLDAGAVDAYASIYADAADPAGQAVARAWRGSAPGSGRMAEADLGSSGDTRARAASGTDGEPDAAPYVPGTAAPSSGPKAAPPSAAAPSSTPSPASPAASPSTPPTLPSAPLLLTPHEGEFTRLVATALGWEPAATASDLAGDRLGTVRRAAAALGATILLKGTRTLVVDPGGAARVNMTGTSRLATAGTGDVLTGLVGGLLAAGLPPFDAGSVGAWLHGRAARLAPAALAAADLPALLVQVFAELGS